MIPKSYLWVVSLVAAALFGSLVREFVPKMPRWILVATTLCFVGAAVAINVYNEAEQRRRDAAVPVYDGMLEPASDSIPEKLSVGEVLLLLGKSRVYASQGMNVLACGRQKLIEIGIEKKGIWVSTTVQDSLGRDVVRIIRNEFQIPSREASFNPKRPDKSTLIAQDSHGQEVLRVRFMNPQALSINGRFTVGGSHVVVIDSEGILSATGRFHIEARNNTLANGAYLLDIGC